MALLVGLDELILDALRTFLIPCTRPWTRRWPSSSSSSRGARVHPTSRTTCHTRKPTSGCAGRGFPHVQLAYDGLQFDVRVNAGDEASREQQESLARMTLAGGSSSTRLTTFTSSQAWASRYATYGHSSVLAIGNFDGIHLGHQAILCATVESARALHAVSTVLTFDPSPRKVLRPESAPLRLSTIAQRMEWFNALGIEAAVIMPFTLELSRLSPEEFVEQILVRDLHVKTVLVGENFHFGHKQAGNVKLLKELGAKKVASRRSHSSGAVSR